MFALKQRRELVNAHLRRPATGDDVQIGLADAGLDRVDIDFLQQLRLQKLADARDLPTTDAPINVGNESMGRSVGRIVG